MTTRRQFVGTGTAALVGFGLGSQIHADSLIETPDLWTVSGDAPSAQDHAVSYSKYHRKTPSLRVFCTSEQAVQRAVRWVRDQGRRFAMRSGGHCFMGFSNHDDVVIDLRHMNSIDIDTSGQTVTVGAGAKVAEIAQMIGRAGFVLAMGTYGGVGIAGHTLGGGFGYRARSDGLLADQLRSLRIVLANGEVVDVDRNTNADLFWACRGGGGGQLGIVTSFTFEMKRAAPQHWVRIVQPVTLRQGLEFLHLWQLWSRDSERHTTTHAQVTARGNSGFLVNLSGLAGGEKSALMTDLAYLLRRKNAVHENYVVSGLNSDLASRMSQNGTSASVNLLTHSHMFNGPMSDDGLVAMAESILRHAGTGMSFNLEALGGAVADTKVDATAFAHRRAEFTVHVQTAVQNPSLRDARTRAMADANAVLGRYASGGVYVNYPDLTLKDWAVQYWGENVARLRSVKAKYDPDNVFSHAQSLAFV